jgi:hypothetical protein
MQRVKETGAGGLKHGKQFFFALGERFGDGAALREKGELVGKKEGDAAVALADRFHTCPCYLARGYQRVEAGWIVGGNACRQDGSLDQRRGQRRTLQALDGIEERVESDTAARR